MQIDKYLIIQMQTSLPLRDVGKVWENVHDTWFCLFSSCFIQLMQALAIVDLLLIVKVLMINNWH